ncbi:MAG: protein Tex, partial [Mycobacteriales bacterium]
DPRAEFSPPKFRDDVTAMEDLKVGMVLEGVVTNVTAFGAFVDIGVHKISDLKPGMLLEGQVTNVAAFGAFVDVGVHQDGLVHVSAMSKTFVKDPRDVVKSGDIVRVKVLDVDVPRKRISLTLRLDDEAAPAPAGGRPDRSGRDRDRGGQRQGGPRPDQRGARPRPASPPPPGNTALADALRRAGLTGPGGADR